MTWNRPCIHLMTLIMFSTTYRPSKTLSNIMTVERKKTSADRYSMQANESVSWHMVNSSCLTRKKKDRWKMEMPGIDPGASRMQSERSTEWATSPHCTLLHDFYFCWEEERRKTHLENITMTFPLCLFLTHMPSKENAFNFYDSLGKKRTNFHIFYYFFYHTNEIDISVLVVLFFSLLGQL